MACPRPLLVVNSHPTDVAQLCVACPRTCSIVSRPLDMHNILAPSRKSLGRVLVLRQHRLKTRSYVNDVVITGTAAVASGSFVLSSLQLLNAIAQLPPERAKSIDSGDDDDAFVWSVATVVSLIPVVNFMVCTHLQLCSHRGRTSCVCLDIIFPPPQAVAVISRHGRWPLSQQMPPDDSTR